MIAWRALAAGAGLVADELAGEPPVSVHPVAAFGRAMTALEQHAWSDDRAAGARYALAGIGGAALAGGLLARAAGRDLALGAAVWSCAAGRCLRETAASVAEALDRGDLPAARRLLPALVGRETGSLDEQEIARAVVESVAENLSDAVVATAVWGVLLGARGALAHRAANTLDAMVGHRSARYARFGWAAARADDAMGWPAARATAVLVALARPSRSGAVWRVVTRDARAHPSPNAGVAEAAFAAALGLRLGGENRYGGRVEVRPALGDGRPAEPADVHAAIGLAARVQRILAALLIGVGLSGLWRAKAGSR